MRAKWKYLLPGVLNAMLLIFLCFLGSDELRMAFDPFRNFIQLVKIMLIAIPLLIIQLIPAFLFSGRLHKVPSNWRMSILLALALIASIPLYTRYIKDIAEAQFDPARVRLCEQLEYNPEQSLKLKGSGISLEDYSPLVRMGKTPALPESASNIELKFTLHDIPPDYWIIVKYSVPITEEIEEYDDTQGQFIFRQNFTVEGDQKRVIYEELKW